MKRRRVTGRRMQAGRPGKIGQSCKPGSFAKSCASPTQCAHLCPPTPPKSSATCIRCSSSHRSERVAFNSRQKLTREGWSHTMRGAKNRRLGGLKHGEVHFVSGWRDADRLHGCADVCPCAETG